MKKRIFIGLSISPELKQKTSPLLRALKDFVPPDCWQTADPGGYHLTLQFLGATEVALLPEISDGLAKISEKSPQFSLKIDRYGAFYREDEPKVLWVASDQASDPIASLHLQTQDLLTELVLKVDERPFRPHVTLAKFKIPSEVRPTIDSHKFHDFLSHQTLDHTQQVLELVLFESLSTDGRSIYRAVGRWPLRSA